ncbi:MAG: ATP-cone domain protein, partial [Bacteroidetes bacterium]|nr:ATP-cone domain protein [Bacteroidota bacterium]
EDKLKNSLSRAGADKEQVNEIVKEVMSKLYNGIPTAKIYRIAFNLLRDSSSPLAAKYHLKRGIMELGPSGFPFEKFIGEILKYKGYIVNTNVIVKGLCVNHEVDVIGEKGNEYHIIECKYHNLPGRVCDVKIPLYIHSRFRDIETVFLKLSPNVPKVYKGWVITNTRFTGDAIQYGSCAGLKLIGWNYPNGESLRSTIDASGLYPVTCLSSLSRQDKKKLLEAGIVLSKEIINNVDVLLNAGVKQSRINTVMNEARLLCDHLAADSRSSENKK